MPIVTAPPIPEKPVHAFTVEDIGALLGPSPASGVEDATGASSLLRSLKSNSQT